MEKQSRYPSVVSLAVVVAMVFLTCPLRAGVEAGGTEQQPSITEPGKTRVLEMSWWSVDGGGGVSNSADLRIVAAIGQPDTGQSVAGHQALASGVWAGVVEESMIFNDGFESGDTDAWSGAVIAKKNGSSTKNPKEKNDV